MSHEPKKRAIDLFRRAVDLDSAARAAFLDQACAGDTDLRRKVEKLLELEERSAGALSAHGKSNRPKAQPANAPPDPQAAPVFDELLRRKSEGEAVDLDAFCKEHAELAVPLRALWSIHFSGDAESEENDAEPKQSTCIVPVDYLPVAAGDPGNETTIRYCIHCATEIGASFACPTPTCEGMPNYYLHVRPPDDVPAETGHLAQAARAATAAPPRQTIQRRESAPLAVLRALAPPTTRHLIYEGVTEIGAGPTASILVDSPEVSASHARLECQRHGSGPPEITLTDCNSTNGTFLNDQRVQQRQVQYGDQIRFASAEFELEPPRTSGPRQTLKVS